MNKRVINIMMVFFIALLSLAVIDFTEISIVNSETNLKYAVEPASDMGFECPNLGGTLLVEASTSRRK